MDLRQGKDSMAQEIHRWRSTTGDPLEGASWDDGVAPGVAATRDLTFSSVALNNETVSISGITYTFKTTINNGVAREVNRGATATESAANLAAAINAGAGAGTLYSTATISHVLTVSAPKYAVIASNPSAGVMRAIAYTLGTAANTDVSLSETSTVASWAGGATTLTGGLVNWANNAIALFDGSVQTPCSGTGRLDDIPFIMRQTIDATHNIGLPDNPFRWDQQASGHDEHLLEGSGSVYLAHGKVITQVGARVRFRIARDGGYLEFQKDPGVLIVESGVVGIKQTSGGFIDQIILDGLDADVTVISGALSFVWSRNGHFISQSVDPDDEADATWVILGGVLECKTLIGTNSIICIDGGLLRLIPSSATLSTFGAYYVVSGGVLDLSESLYEIPGNLILREPGVLWGSLVSPGSLFIIP